MRPSHGGTAGSVIDRKGTVRLLRILAVVLTSMLVLAACAGDEEPQEEPSPTPTPTPTPSPSPTTSPSPSPGLDGDSPSPEPTPTDTGTAAGDPAAQVPAIADTCTLEGGGEVERIRIAYPEGWLVQEGCQWFDPEAESVEEGTEPSVAVSWRVAEVAFERAADVSDEVADPIRYVGARSAYQAVRIAGEATGQGLREEGEPVVMWLVDLDPGTDDQGGTLIGTAHAGGGASFDAAAYALDRMADSMLVQPPASQELVVTRLESGGTPATVTWAQDEGCFRLHAGGPDGQVVDEECGPTTPGSSGLRLVLLENEQTRMLAGIASSRIQRVTVPAASTPSGGTTVSTEGGGLFALPVREPPFEVTGHTYTGEVVTTLEFGG